MNENRRNSADVAWTTNFLEHLLVANVKNADQHRPTDAVVN